MAETPLMLVMTPKNTMEQVPGLQVLSPLRTVRITPVISIGRKTKRDRSWSFGVRR
jgi:hypothetical protein